MTPRRSSGSRRTPYQSTGWKGVLTTPEPFQPPDVLQDLKNGYLADPPNPSGAYGRPGVSLLFSGDSVDPNGRWECVHTHTNLDASSINFTVRNGKLYRVNPELTIAENVTPVGITIDAGATTRVFALSVVGQLAFTDGVNRPWEATNLTSSPITGTYIDYDGHGVAWTAYAGPAEYGGAPFMILAAVNSIARRADISWAEPGQFAIGWQQDTFDNNWTLNTNDSGPLYALVGTNTALNYYRTRSIGSATGVVGPDLASTATEDAISFNVGTQSAQTTQKFGLTQYFADAIGRPYSWTPGSPPSDIWKQMRGIVKVATTGFPTTTAVVATAALEPTLNIYIVAIWSPDPALLAPPTEAYVFDAPTGTYMGRWSFEDDGEGGVGIELLGVFTDSAGRATLVIGAEGGFMYSFNSLSTIPSFLTTEGGLLLTTEDGRMLTTEGLPAVWTDNGSVPFIQLMPGRFGYSDDTNLNVDQITVTALNDVPLRVTVDASMTTQSVEGIPEPSASQNGLYRMVVGCDVFGRGPGVTVMPLSAEDQFVALGVTMYAIPSTSGPEDA